MTSKQGRNSPPGGRVPSPEGAPGDRDPKTSAFELTDANPRAIAWAAGGVLVLLVLASLVVWGVRHFFSPGGPNYRSAMLAQEHRFERRAPLKQAPPGVRIQPAKSLKSVRQRETQKLRQYRWTDSSHTVATIPIERAVEIIAAENKRPDTSGGRP